MLKDTGDKLSAADRQAIEAAMDGVKKANEGNDAAAIQRALDELTAAQHKAAEALYKQGGRPWRRRRRRRRRRRGGWRRGRASAAPSSRRRAAGERRRHRRRSGGRGEAVTICSLHCS